MTLTKSDLVEALKTTKNDLLGVMRSNNDMLRRDLNKKIDEKIGQLGRKIDDKIGQLDKKVDEKIGQLDKKIDQKVDGGIHLLRVLIEDVQANIKLLAEGQSAAIERLENRDKMLNNHEMRITKLEDYTYTKGRI